MSGDPTDNLHTLHSQEEAVRAQSLAAIGTDGALKDHWTIISEAMNAVYAFSHDHKHQSDSELTLQMLGIRLFNAAATSIKLGQAGYYQKAFDGVRDVLETYFLVDYLTTNPEKIAEWKTADKKTRIAKFGPGFVRTELDKRDRYTSGVRKKVYDLISEYASHASYPGFRLIMNDQNLGEIGPFFNQQKHDAWLRELATRLMHAAVILVSNPEGQDQMLLLTRAHYLESVNQWMSKYMPTST